MKYEFMSNPKSNIYHSYINSISIIRAIIITLRSKEVICAGCIGHQTGILTCELIQRVIGIRKRKIIGGEFVEDMCNTKISDVVVKEYKREE